MIFKHTVIVSFDTLPVVQWDALDVDLTFDKLCGFHLRLHPRTIAEELALRAAWRVVVTLNGKPVLRGVVDHPHLDEKRDPDEYSIDGRESVAVAADCDIINVADLTSLTMGAAMPTVLGPFKIGFVPGPRAAAKEILEPLLGKRPYHAIQHLADEAGLATWTDPVAGVIFCDEYAALLAQARKLPPIQIFRIPGNPANNVERFTYDDEKCLKMNTCSIIADMQIQATIDNVAAAPAVPAFAQGLPLPALARKPDDPELAEYRPLLIHGRGAKYSDFAQRPMAELKKRLAQATRLGYELAGWCDKKGVPYSDIRMAQVADARREIYGEFFVAAARLTAKRSKDDPNGGFNTLLSLIDPGCLAA
jgi:prophage tail gpP-like protein